MRAAFVGSLDSDEIGGSGGSRASAAVAPALCPAAGSSVTRGGSKVACGLH